MARKQVIVQLDDELVERLDREADARGLNRSELLRRAAGIYLDASDTLRKDREFAEAYRRRPQDAVLNNALFDIAVENWPE